MRVLTLSTGSVRSIRFDPSGRTMHVLATGPTEPQILRSLSILDLPSGEVLGHWEFRGTHAVHAPDFRSLYYTRPSWESDYCHIRRLDLLTDRQVVVYWTNDCYSGPLALTPNGHILAIASPACRDDGYTPGVRRVDVWHGTQLAPVEPDPTRQSLGCIAYSPDGDLLAAGGTAGVRTWRGRAPVDAYAPGCVGQLAWSSNEWLAWGVEGGVSVARPGTPDPARVVALPERDLSAIAFSPDGRLLLAGSQAGACHLIDVGSGCVATAFDWRIGPVAAVAFAPDGLTCAGGGENGQVVVWDVDA